MTHVHTARILWESNTDNFTKNRYSRAHHWSFGNMLPVPGLDSAAIAGVTAYVRWLQQKAGVQ